jgi:peptide/nickel transport system ATP-binding protein
MSLLRVDRLSVGLARPDRMIPLVEDASFEIEAGEIMGLVGESGSGKTISCRAMMRLLPGNSARITGGSVLFEGRDLVGMPEAELRTMRGRRLAMVFQNPLSHLNPVMTIGQQIAEPLRRIEGLSKAEARRRAAELLSQVGIPDPVARLDNYPHEFSGGMRQRAMIAGALACRPALLIADEPTTALDVTVQAQILRLLLDLRDKTGLAIVLITHDLGVVSQTCDRLAVMYAGRVVESGTVGAVLADPRHPYTARLLASQPRHGIPGEKLPSIAGQPPGLGEVIAGCRFRPRCVEAIERCAAARPDLVSVRPGWLSACHRSFEPRVAG